MGYAVLTGGTFFTLIVESLREESKGRSATPNKKGPLSNTEVYKSLMKVVGYEPENVKDTTLVVNVSKYKNCQINKGQGLPFQDKFFLSNLEERAASEHPLMTSMMNDFVFKHIDPSKAALLGRRLFELIDQDKSIPNDSVLSGKLDEYRAIDLAELLLASWLYILRNKVDNTRGTETIATWMPKEPGSQAKGEFTSDLGIEKFKNLQVLFSQTKEEVEGMLNFSIKNVDFVGDRKYRIDQPVATDKQHLPKFIGSPLGVNVDYSETEIASNLRNPIQYYLQKTRRNYSTIKTLLYQDEPRPFYSFYEPADILKVGVEKIDDFDAFKARELPKCFILIGTGGMGKSMMLRHLLLNSISNYDTLKTVPILVMLKDFKYDDEDLLSVCYRKINDITPIERSVFEGLLLEGKCLLLFDGYDEIKSKFVPEFERQLNQMIFRFPDNQYILTSRPCSEFVQLGKFSIYHLAPLSQKKAVHLVKRLEFKPDEPEIKEGFLNILEKEWDYTLDSFIENPLLLTILLMSYDMHADIPTKTAEFYDNAYETLAWRHDRTKGGYKRQFHCGLDNREFKNSFSEFSAYTFSNEIYEFSEHSLIETIKEVQNESPSKRIDPEAFKHDCINSLCLLIQDGANISFVHRSFQEYFTAFFFAEQVEYEEWYEYAMIINDEHKDSAFNIFRFLYELKQEKFEQYVIEPYLYENLEGLDFNEGFENYLRTFYPKIEYKYGDLANFGWGTNITDPLMEFIHFEKDLYFRLSEEDLPFIPELAIEYYYDGGVLTRKGEFWAYREGSTYNEEAEPNGYIMQVDTIKLLRNPKSYPTLYEALLLHDNKLRTEFNKLKNYLVSLEHQSTKKKTNLLRGRRSN